MSPREIRAAFDACGTDKGKDHGYEYLYAEVFKDCNVKSLLEIGVEYGHSIAAWKRLFPEAHIAGIDICEHNLVIPKDSFHYIVGDSGDEQILRQANTTYDIIIDDASNDLFDQALTFNLFKHSFNHCYVIEDIFSNQPDYNDRVETLERHLYESGFKHIYRYPSKKKRNGVLLNTMALSIYK